MQVHKPGAGHLVPPLHGLLCKCCSTSGAHTSAHSQIGCWIPKRKNALGIHTPCTAYCASMLPRPATVQVWQVCLLDLHYNCTATLLLQVSHRFLLLLGRAT